MTERFVVLADWEIRDPLIYFHRIWRPARARKIARVPWLDALTLIYAYEGKVFWPSGRPFQIPEIDDVFRGPENRWMSDFLAADESDEWPAQHCRVIPRLRLIALCCEITAAENLKHRMRNRQEGSRQAPGWPNANA